MKGYILFDKIPVNCYECGCHNYHFCIFTGENIENFMDEENRGNECPIKEFPKEREEKHTGDYVDNINEGFNLCLDMITAE